MKRVIPLAVVLFLTGCIPYVKREFPAAPPSALIPCATLKEIQQTTKLSDVLEVVTQNYTEHHICQIRVDTWIQWYNEQKKIFNEVK